MYVSQTRKLFWWVEGFIFDYTIIPSPRNGLFLLLFFPLDLWFFLMIFFPCFFGIQVVGVYSTFVSKINIEISYPYMVFSYFDLYSLRLDKDSHETLRKSEQKLLWSNEKTRHSSNGEGCIQLTFNEPAWWPELHDFLIYPFCFSIFAGLAILCNFVLMLTWVPACLVFYQRYCRATCCCCLSEHATPTGLEDMDTCR